MFPPRKSIIRRNNVLLLLYKLSPLSIVLNFKLFALLTETFSLIVREDSDCYKNKTQFQSSPLTEFSLSLKAKLKNKRKIAAVSRETPESTRNSRVQNTLES